MELVFNQKITFSISKRRGIWYGREYHNGKRVSEKSLGTKLKKEADMWMQQMNAVKYSPELQKRLSGKKRYFGEEIEKYRKRSVDLVSKSSQKSGIAYDSRIRRCFDMVPKDMVLEDITKDDLQNWYSELLVLAPKTIKEVLRLAKAFFNDMGVVPNPVASFKVPKIQQRERPFWTLEEIARILTKAPSTGDRLFWALMAYAGLRSQEAMDLEWGDISLDNNQLTVRNGKGNKARVIPIHSVILAELAKFPQSERTGMVVNVQPKTAFGRLKLLKRILAGEEFQVPGPVTLHRFRHSFASNLIRNGANVKSVQLLMGHANINITLDTYGHLLPGDLEKAICLLR